MYWSRTGSWLDGASVLLLCALLWFGGWLLAIHAIRSRASERLVIGLALGLILFIVLANLIAQVLPLVPAYWLAAVAITLMGLASAWKSGRRWWDRSGLRGWPLLVAVACLALISALINRGLAIFDDYHNLPIVSTLAAGDIPPHFYLNPSSSLAYHYGLHLFAAGLVRIGGMFSWSAFDLSKSIVLALTIVLTYVWALRVTRRVSAAVLGAVAMAIGGGTRWLLLLAPPSTISSLGSGLQMLGSGLTTAPNLYTALLSPWKIQGDGPIPFPFAFVSSLFAPSILSLGGSGVLSTTIILVVLLSLRRRLNLDRIAVLIILFASLGLIAEVDFVLLWAGVALSLILWGWKNGAGAKRSLLIGWGSVLLVSGLLVLLQGGVLTGLFKQIVVSLQGAGQGSSVGLAGFSLHWPPAIVSSHFGPLSLFNPRQALIVLLEIGPIVLVAPGVVLWTLRRLTAGDLLFGGIGLGSVLGAVIPLVVWYGVLRDSGRSLGVTLSWWLLLGIPVVWRFWEKSGSLGRLLAALGYSVGILGGVVLLGIELVAAPRPQLTYFVGPLDARLSQSLWNRLPPIAQVFDLVPYRSVTLFGREVTASSDLRTPLPEWQALAEHPDPAILADAGFNYVYMDESWWGRMTDQLRESYSQPCVQVLSSFNDDNGHFRKLLDVGGCR